MEAKQSLAKLASILEYLTEDERSSYYAALHKQDHLIQLAEGRMRLLSSMDLVAEEARQNGLTPEILEKLLAAD